MRSGNGAGLAVGALAAIVVAAKVSQLRGSRSPADDESAAGLQLAHQAQSRAEAELPDVELARRLFSGADVLAGMPFSQAVNVDPRRIDALIAQKINRALSSAMGPPDPGFAHAYASSMADLRRSFGGRLTVSAITGLVERNLDDSMFRVLPMLPAYVRESIRRQLPVFDEAFAEAADVARRAAMVSSRSSDRMDWASLAEYLRGHPDQVRIALTSALPSPAGVRLLGA